MLEREAAKVLRLIGRLGGHSGNQRCDVDDWDSVSLKAWAIQPHIESWTEDVTAAKHCLRPLSSYREE